MRFSAPIGATSLRLAPVLSLYNLRPLCTPLTLTARPANLSTLTLIAAISPLEQVQEAMTSPQSKPLPPFVTSIQAEFDQYLDLQRRDSPIFCANSIGLEVVPYSVPQGLVAHFSIVQPGHKKRNLRVCHNPLRPSTVPSELPLEGLQIGEGKSGCLYASG
jgi:hypothetical protein